MTGPKGQIRTHVAEDTQCAMWVQVTWDILTCPPNIYLVHAMCHPILIFGETATNQIA